MPERAKGAENGAERADNRMSRSGAVSDRRKKRLSGSGAGVAKKERSGELAESDAHSSPKSNMSLIS